MLQEIMKKQDALEKENKELKQTILQQNQKVNKNEEKELLENVTFSEFGKSNGISIYNNGKSIRMTKNGLNHCYLNLRMESGVYHFKYKFHGCRGTQHVDFHGRSITVPLIPIFTTGVSTNNTYSGDNIHMDRTTSSYSDMFGGINNNLACYIGRLVNKGLYFENNDGSEYEIKVDMNKREFWISHNRSPPILYVDQLPSPLYPFAALGGEICSLDLLSVYHQN